MDTKHCTKCGQDKPLSEFSGRKFNGRPHVDHDHNSGKVRELLCGDCNRMLGCSHDDPTTLRRAAEYLERHG